MRPPIRKVEKSGLFERLYAPALDMTNAFLAAKVIFCNEMYDIAASCGISYEETRRLWLADGRIGESHTRVFPDDRGYGGSCFPKDVRSLLFTAQSAGLPLHQLKGTQWQNAVYHEEEKRV